VGGGTSGRTKAVGAAARSARGVSEERYGLNLWCFFFRVSFIVSRSTCLPGVRGNRTRQIFFRGCWSFPTNTLRLPLTGCWAADADPLSGPQCAPHIFGIPKTCGERCPSHRGSLTSMPHLPIHIFTPDPNPPPGCARGIENGFRTRQYPLTTREGRVILSSLS